MSHLVSRLVSLFVCSFFGHIVRRNQCLISSCFYYSDILEIETHFPQSNSNIYKFSKTRQFSTINYILNILHDVSETQTVTNNNY